MGHISPFKLERHSVTPSKCLHIGAQHGLGLDVRICNVRGFNSQLKSLSGEQENFSSKQIDHHFLLLIVGRFVNNQKVVSVFSDFLRENKLKNVLETSVFLHYVGDFYCHNGFVNLTYFCHILQHALRFRCLAELFQSALL